MNVFDNVTLSKYFINELVLFQLSKIFFKIYVYYPLVFFIVYQNIKVFSKRVILYFKQTFLQGKFLRGGGFEEKIPIGVTVSKKIRQNFRNII